MPAVCTTSLWKSTPASRVILPISAMGWMVPTSLLPCMIDTRTVSGRMALRTSSGSTRPPPSTGTLVNSQPRFSRYSMVSRTAWCSTAEVMRCLPFFCCASAVPRMAQLSDSVPPLVK